MKKTICLLLALLLTASLLTGCGPNIDTTHPKNAERSIVATIFPIADWVWHVLGDQADKWSITVLEDNGADLHSYQPTAEDMIQVADCDLFLCVGGESDKWVDDALNNGGKPERRALKLIEKLGSAAVTEELVEGMEAEEEEEEEGPAFDEHIWLSVKNAAILCQVLADTLSEIDPEHASSYAEASKAYIEQLNALDQRFEEMAANAFHDTVVCADRFPFRYLMDDYHINYYAAFLGCSAESEASFETVVFLAGKVDELNLHGVIQTETSDGKLSHTVLDNCESKEHCVIFTLDSIQSGKVGYSPGGSPEPFYPDYLSIMENNLDLLSGALNAGRED